jgi:hypothetical protein
MVDLIYTGDSRVHFICEGKTQRNVSKGDIITNIPQAVYDRDLKQDTRYKLVSEKKANKMQEGIK